MPNFRRFLSRRWQLGSLAAVAILFGLSMLHPYPRQSVFGPTIRGKPWCVWEDAVRRNIRWQDHEKSYFEKTLRWFGVQHEEMDINELFDHEEMLPLLLHLAEDADPQVRRGAVSTFYWHRKLQDRSALPILRVRLKDDDMRCRIDAAMAIVTIDPKERVLPVLMRILDDPSSEHRYEAMRAVTYVACVDDAAFDAMVRHAKDANPSIRKEIMSELFRHGSKSVPTLLHGLEDSDAGVRSDAAASLENLGVAAKEAVPALERLLNDKEKQVRDAAGVALAAIDPEHYRHLKARRKIE